VIDNRTGLVYNIENFHIRTLKNGCILRDGDSLVYDMRINASKQLEFYSIFSNSTVTVKDCFKDKYGTRYVMNDKLNQYDAESNTYFFNLWEYTGSNANAGLVGYFLTSDNRAVKVTYDNTLSTTVVDAALMGEDKVSHRLADSDIFDIYYPAGITTTSEAYRVSHTVVFGFHTSQKNVFGSQNFYAVNTKNSVTGIFAYSSVNAKLFIDHDIVLELVTNSDGTKSLYEEKGVEKALSNFVLDSTSPSGSTFLPSANLTKRLLLDGVTLDSSGKLIHYGLSGNTYYDFGVEKKGDGSYQAIVYDEGTKSEEQVIVTMQPITR
jgi:hypothetical protein